MWQVANAKCGQIAKSPKKNAARLDSFEIEDLAPNRNESGVD